MNRKFSVLVVAFSIALAVVPVMAAPPLNVHIEVPTIIEALPDPTSDNFTATGPAVDAGLMCSTGEVFNLSIIVSGPPGGTFSILRVLKHFVCDDGSGTFDVKMVVRLDLTTNETIAHWRVVGGTGAYVGLHGNGKLIGIPIAPGSSILDIYDGRMH
ncbi:hypothetical protein ACFLS5_05390 [Candidatus Bipolaricaulota bacterium]